MRKLFDARTHVEPAATNRVDKGSDLSHDPEVPIDQLRNHGMADLDGDSRSGYGRVRILNDRLVDLRYRARGHRFDVEFLEDAGEDEARGVKRRVSLECS